MRWQSEMINFLCAIERATMGWMENGEFKLYPLILGHKLSHVYIWKLGFCCYAIYQNLATMFSYLKNVPKHGFRMCDNRLATLIDYKENNTTIYIQWEPNQDGNKSINETKHNSTLDSQESIVMHTHI